MCELYKAMVFLDLCICFTIKKIQHLLLGNTLDQVYVEITCYKFEVLAWGWEGVWAYFSWDLLTALKKKKTMKNEKIIY